VIVIPDSACQVCAYWTARADTERARVLAGDETAYRAEVEARRELREHLARETHTGSENAVHTERPFTGAGAYMPPRPGCALRRGHP
jgi:hypothetical protein